MKTKLTLQIAFILFSINLFAQQSTRFSLNLGPSIDLSSKKITSKDNFGLIERGIFIYGLEIERNLGTRFALSFEPAKINRLLQFKTATESFSKFKLGYLSLPVIAKFALSDFNSNQNIRMIFGIGVSANLLFSKELDKYFNDNNINYTSHFKIKYDSGLVPGIVTCLDFEKKIKEKKFISIGISYINIQKTSMVLNSSFEHTVSNITSNFNQSIIGKSRTNLLQLKLKYYYAL